MLISDNAKHFEKPDAGLFLAVLADVVYLKDKPTNYGLKNKTRLVWILDAKDSEGNHYRVITEATSSYNEKARLYSLTKDILGAPPPVPFDPDSMIGAVNQLVITREKSPDGTKEYANVKAILPARPDQKFAIPAGFVRDINKPAKGSTAAVASTATKAASTVAAPAAVASMDDTEDIPF